MNKVGLSSWFIACSPLKRALQVPSLAADIVLCCWVLRHFNLTVPTSTPGRSTNTLSSSCYWSQWLQPDEQVREFFHATLGQLQDITGLTCNVLRRGLADFQDDPLKSIITVYSWLCLVSLKATIKNQDETKTVHCNSKEGVEALLQVSFHADYILD